MYEEWSNDYQEAFKVSINTVADPQEVAHYQVEILNSLYPPPRTTAPCSESQHRSSIDVAVKPRIAKTLQLNQPRG